MWPFAVLARHGRLHAVVEDLDRHAADRFEGRHVAAQERLQILMQDKAGDDMPGMTEHQREQPDDPGDARLVLEAGDEAGEVDLRLMAGRRLEANLEGLRPVARPDRGDEALHRGVSAGIAALAQLARQSRRGQLRESRHPLAQIVEIGGELVRPADLTRSIDRQLQAALDVFANRLRITAGASRDRGHGQSLAVKIQDHHQFSKLDHRRPRPNHRRTEWSATEGKPGGPGRAPDLQARAPAREFSLPTFRENSTPSDSLPRRSVPGCQAHIGARSRHWGTQQECCRQRCWRCGRRAGR